MLPKNYDEKLKKGYQKYQFTSDVSLVKIMTRVWGGEGKGAHEMRLLLWKMSS